MATAIDNTAPINFAGGLGDDVAKGGLGNDSLAGNGGNDALYGGLGNDDIRGGDGADKLYGDGDAVIGKTALIGIQDSHPVTVAFNYEEAGYRNTLGVYKVDAATGKIGDVQIVWSNASLAGSGGDLIADVSKATIAAQPGDQIGFFLIGDGFSKNNWNKLEAGKSGSHFEFRNADGTAATVASKNPQLVLVDTKGKTTAVQGDIYHTAAYDADQKLNPDNVLHTMGLLQTVDGKVKIGFEDLFGGGDKDYDDAVFTVDIGQANARVLNAHFQQQLETGTVPTDVAAWSKMNPGSTADKIQGQAGADTIDGMEGNDLLAGGGVGTEWALVDGNWVYQGLAANNGLPKAGLVDQSDDVIHGSTGDDVLLGGAGHDKLSGGLGNDTLNGDAGDDRLLGEAGDDVLNGGDGNDALDGGAGADSLRGGAGDDRLDGGEAADALFGGTGADTLDGGVGDDKLFGNEGADRLRGGLGADHLEGGADSDQLLGEAGADRLLGGLGDDQLWGGEWKADGAGDTFVFMPGSGKDQVNDFELGSDLVDLAGFQTDWGHVQGAMVDKGWATYLDLARLDGGQAGDLVILKGVHAKDLHEDSFVLGDATAAT